MVTRSAAPPLPPLPPPHGILLCTLILQKVMDVMVYLPAPPPLWNRISLCFPQGGRRTRPPPLWNRMVFPVAIHTHTHHVFVNVWPFYLPTPSCGTGWFSLLLGDTHTHTHTHHVSVYVWHSLSVHALLLSLRSILPPPFPPPWYPVMYSCTSISNGRHVYSPHPPPLWNRISLCFPSPHPCGFEVFQLCVRAREEGEPAPPPPPRGTGWFSLLPHTHTHTHPTCLCKYGILSPYMLFC